MKTLKVDRKIKAMSGLIRRVGEPRLAEVRLRGELGVSESENLEEEKPKRGSGAVLGNTRMVATDSRTGSPEGGTR